MIYPLSHIIYFLDILVSSDFDFTQIQDIVDQPEQKMTGCIDFIEVFVNK